MNGDRAPVRAFATSGSALEPSPELAARRSSLVEFVFENVACRIELVAVDRRRKLAAYDVVLANKRATELTCRLYGTERDARETIIALFEVAAKSLGRSRFFVPLGRNSRWERVFIEIAGDGPALLFETRLPPHDAVAPVGRAGLVGVVLGTLALAVALFLVVMHATQPATVIATIRARSVALTAAHPPLVPARMRLASAKGDYVSIDDGADAATAGFAYVGAWQHIKKMRDGRSEGTSSRTYHEGNRATFTFDGAGFKVFGIKGPTGGYAELSIDGVARALLLFYAPKKQVGVEMYASEPLRPGRHAVQFLVVDMLHGAGKRRYVNIDGAAYLAR